MVRLGGAKVVPLLVLLAFPALSYAQAAVPAPAPELSVEQIRTFLKDAKVIRTRSTDKGVTAPKRLTLSDGNITHDAVFQAIDDRQMVANLGGGGRQAHDRAQLRRLVQIQHRRLRARGACSAWTT